MNAIRRLLLIKEGEGSQVAFFLIIFLCLGTGMAVGRGSADALFLKRYGIEYLPVMYLMLSVIFAVSFTIYAAFVDRLPPERFFYLLLTLQAALLFVFWCVIIYTTSEVIYPAYFLLYELISEVIVIHATFYTGQNLDTLQSKRLMPIIFSGYQMGMVTGGLLLALVVPVIGVENALLIWCVMIMLSMAILLAWHKKQGVSPFFIPPPKSRRNRVTMAIQEVRQGLNFIGQSRLLRNSSYALFFMVIMFYVISFSVNKIYSEKFDNEDDLTSFFGILVAATNLTALLFQLFISNRVVEKIGVRRSKLIFPVTTVISYLLLLISPAFYMAIIASINNGAVMPAFRNPVRQMFFNVLPDYMRGRARATSVALVLPVAMFTCGTLILYLQHSKNPLHIIYLGLFCAVMYTFFCYRMGNVYVAALIDNMKEKLYLPSDVSLASYRGNSRKIYSALMEGLENDDDSVSLSYARLMLNAFPQRSIEPVMSRAQRAGISVADQMIRLTGLNVEKTVTDRLLEYADNRDEHFRATVYDVIFSRHGNEYRELIEQAMLDNNPRIRAAGIKGALSQNSQNLMHRGMNSWHELIAGGPQHRMAATDLGGLIMKLGTNDRRELLDRYSAMYVSLMHDADTSRRAKIYRLLQDWPETLQPSIYDAIRADLTTPDLELRTAAVSCLNLLPDDMARQDAVWAALGDGHANVRNAALGVIEKLNTNAVYRYHEWLLGNHAGTPRAQKELLRVMISHGVNHALLEQIVEAKARYASELLSASYVLMNEERNDISMNMVRTIIDERLIQIIDLVLMAMEPIINSDALSVVRAGLSSKDSSHRANAQETLQSMNSGQTIVLMGCLVEKNLKKIMKLGYGRKFQHSRDALSWCVDIGDKWLSECSSRALRTMTV